MRRRLLFAVALGSLVAGCGDPLPSPERATVSSRSSMALLPSDDRIEQRARLRNIPDSVISRLVAEHHNIVVVGIKQENAPIGVGSRGEKLVPQAELREHVLTVRALAARVLHEFRNIPAIAVQLPDASVAIALRRLPWVDYVVANTPDLTPDVLTETCVEPLTSAQSVGWAVSRVRADSAWSIATGTNGALLILDDGLDLGQGQPAADEELPWWAYYSFEGQGSDPDDGSHGTLVFSAAGARNNGIGIVGSAPSAEMHYGDIYPNGINVQWQNAAALIIDTLLPQTKVVSISSSSKLTSEPPFFTALRDEIINAYYQRGVLFVASTGNQSSSSIIPYPAAYAEVIGVGGSGLSDEYVYNNYGGTSVDVAAPATDVPVVCAGAGAIGEASGTSWSTPLVAGVMMLMRQEFPSVSNDDLRAHLRETAVPMADPQKSGSGRVDALAALGPIPPPPPPPVVSISGPSAVRSGATCIWQANVTGTPPFTYYWLKNGGYLGSSFEITTSFGTSGSLYLQVWDAYGSASTNKNITVSPSAPICYF